MSQKRKMKTWIKKTILSLLNKIRDHRPKGRSEYARQGIAIPVIILCFICQQLSAVGDNKVQYSYFRWDILKTPHFNIYYNKGQRLLAEQTALILEDSAAQISRNFRFELTHVIPVIVYNSHNDFEQSNVVLEMIDEGTGGFTEIFKTRIVVPYMGSYGDYQHVLHHELTHGFQYNILLGGFLGITSNQGVLFYSAFMVYGRIGRTAVFRLG